ncbi:MAG: glycosyltransferase [Pacificimonas sp.]
MRILTAIYGPGRGGSERAVLRLMRKICHAGHEVRILGENADGKARPVALALQIARAARIWKPDILFAPGQTYALPFAIAKALKGTEAPLVSKISNMPGSNRQARLWLSLQGFWTARFVAPDAASAEELTRTTDLSDEQITAIDNPCADRDHLISLHQAGHSKHAGLHILAAGRIVPQKNFGSLIAAFANISGEQDRLTIIGDGPDLEREKRILHDKRTRYGTACNIDMPGHVTDPAPYFAKASAFASSSMFEGLPAVLIEALATGLPIAATDSSPAIRALLEGEGHGIVVPLNDDEALASALEKLRTFQPNRTAMFTAALRFTAEAAAPVYLDLFQTLAHGAKNNE